MHILSAGHNAAWQISCAVVHKLYLLMDDVWQLFHHFFKVALQALVILKLVLFNQALVYVQSHAAGLDKTPANIKRSEATKTKSDCNSLSDW